MYVAKFADLLGVTLKSVEVREDKEAIAFASEDGRAWRQYHDQNCCESVAIEDICGDLNDLIGSPIVTAEEASGETAQPDGWQKGEYVESFTWTFYRLATAKGLVTIRWFGESNGYYSESVDFEEVR